MPVVHSSNRPDHSDHPATSSLGGSRDFPSLFTFLVLYPFPSPTSLLRGPFPPALNSGFRALAVSLPGALWTWLCTWCLSRTLAIAFPMMLSMPLPGRGCPVWSPSPVPSHSDQIVPSQSKGEMPTDISQS